MKIPNAQIAVMLARERLAEIFGVAELTQDTSGDRSSFGDRPSFRDVLWDAVYTVRGQSFGLIWIRLGSLGHLGGTMYKLGNQMSFDREVMPLLVVPYMGKAAQEHCAQSQLCWIDLSGNARIVTSAIFYQNLGHSNRFPRPGRPESAFGPRGSRITRRLLMDPSKVARQRDLASSTSLDEGHTSRIVHKLLETGLIERGEDGISVVDADALLDAWREDYRFDRHHVIRGHIPALGGDTLIHSLGEALSKTGEPYAATALPAAWLWTRYAPFHLSTVYISTLPSTGLKKDLGFQEEDGEVNTWLVVPNDEGVFHGAELVDGIRCVHPVQTYADLKDHPEPATDAAAELRRRLPWRGNNDI